MKLKEMKKLTLSKKTISNLSAQGMDSLNGGVLTNPLSLALPGGTSCELPCDNNTNSCIPKDCVQITTDPTYGPDFCPLCGIIIDGRP